MIVFVIVRAVVKSVSEQVRPDPKGGDGVGGEMWELGWAGVVTSLWSVRTLTLSCPDPKGGDGVGDMRRRVFKIIAIRNVISPKRRIVPM